MSQNLKIVSFAEFSEAIDELTEEYIKLKDIFRNQKKNAEKINETDTWTGEAQRAMYAKYMELNSNYDPIEYSLEVFIKFLIKTRDDYTLISKAIEKNIEDFAETLDVVS